MTDPQQRAARAQQILDDPLFTEAGHALQRSAIERLASIDVADVQRLQVEVLRLQCIFEFGDQFRSMMNTGSSAAPPRPVA